MTIYAHSHHRWSSRTCRPHSRRAGARYEAFITAKIPLLFSSLSAVQIYDFHIFTAVYSSLHGFVWNQHNDQLPVGLLAQLEERCTGIAEVMGSNPVQAWIFSRPYFRYCSSSVYYCEDPSHIHGTNIVHKYGVCDRVFIREDWNWVKRVSL